ncbi:MAG: tetraacyldisaccharide 4'-kinase [Candidatus Omnitrophica bacterium]|nr:tetraacyldisaccharide 4'-kinase [Candidatus Omnitrophota bacterium]
MKGLESFYGRGRITAAYILLFPLLLVFSCVYGVAVVCIAWLYRRGTLASLRPRNSVISIGNITLGGSGKTPLAEYAAAKLFEAGCPVAVLMRGYGRPSVKKGADAGSFEALGDEGSMIEENAGGRWRVLAGRDRAFLVRELEAGGFRGAIILDDGFQHWRVKRDCDIVAVDATRPFGNGLLLPAGHLREPRSALRRASVLCMTRCDQAAPEAVEALERTLLRLNPTALVVETVHEPAGLYDLKIKTKFDTDVLRGVPVGLVCGIAQPGSFEKTVVAMGGQVVSRAFFRDHHVYSAGDLSRCCRRAVAAGARLIVTTQKDAQRLERLARATNLGMDILVLKIGVRIRKNEAEFNARLRSLCPF